MKTSKSDPIRSGNQPDKDSEMKRKIKNIFFAMALFVPILWETPGNLSLAAVQTESISTAEIQENIFDATILPGGEFVMVGERGTILRSEDKGKSWEKIASGINEPLFSVSFPNKRFGWISGNSGLILHSQDGGKTWVRQESGTDKDLLAVHFMDDRHGIAGGDWGQIFVTQNGGMSWDKVSLSQDVVVYGVRMLSPDGLIAVGEFGMIFHSADGGKSWQERPSGTEQSLFCLSSENQRLFSAGMDGVIVFSEDEGKTWNRAKSQAGLSIYGIRVEGETGWAVGDLGTILQSRDHGRTWRKIETPMQYRLSWIGSAVFTQNSEAMGFVAGSKGLYLKIMNNELTWK